MDILEKYDLKESDIDFYYRFLQRLKQDCDYYLGNGGRYHGHLWTKDEYEQIKLMKAIYKALPEKPNWLTPEQIKEYELNILPHNSLEGMTNRLALRRMSDGELAYFFAEHFPRSCPPGETRHGVECVRLRNEYFARHCTKCWELWLKKSFSGRFRRATTL